MTYAPAPLCASCRHLREGDRLTCDAFLDGIPETILGNRVDHRQPVEGDHGIRYEPVADGDPQFDPFRDEGFLTEVE